MASPVDTSVKFYDESFPGAPILGNSPGSEVALLHACLVTGFGLRSATIQVASGVATVTTANEPKNANMLHSVILVEGVTGAMAALNGEQKITAVSSTTLQFATTLADGAAAGSITIRTAPGGWERQHYDAARNIAVFRSANPQSTKKCIRVDGSRVQYTHVRGYDNMVDVDVGSGPFPTFVQAAEDAFRWWKGYNTTPASGYVWELATDGRALIYAPAIFAGDLKNTFLYFFGDTIPDYNPAPHECLISSSGGINVSSSGSYTLAGSAGRDASYVFSAKATSGIGSAIGTQIVPVVGNNAFSGDDNMFGAFPSMGGKLLLSKMAVLDSASRSMTNVLRAYLPGLYYVPQRLIGNPFQRKSTDVVNGKTMRALRTFGGGGNADEGSTAYQKIFIDITGPWR